MSAGGEVSPALVLDAHQLGRLKTAAWDAVRSGDVADTIEVGRALKSAEEVFRARWVPRAREVFATCDHTIGQPLSVFRRTSTGRAVLIYTEDHR